MTRFRNVGILLSLVLIACQGPHSSGADAGQDAGSAPSGPLPAPLLRLDDNQIGTTHVTTYQGSVASNGQPSMVPASLGMVTPADELSVGTGSGSFSNLYYTLPRPFRVPFVPQDEVKITYSERVAGTGSSYGVLMETITGQFKLLVDDGEYGSAFTDTPEDRLNFSFTPDTQPDGQEPDPCGTKVHFPGLVSQGQETRRLFPGQAAQFTLSDGTVVTFTLLDLWRIEGDTCGTAPDYSIAYIVQPST